jgi:hypothetical protein
MARRLAAEVSAEAISWDTGNLHCEGNHLQLWSYLQYCPQEWVVVLEDDAEPCEDFREQLSEMLAQASTPIVSLYLGRGRPDQWQLPISSVISHEACFIRSDTLLNTVGYAIRTELLAALVPSLARSLRLTTRRELPERMTAWAQRRHHLISYTRPSIVQHSDVPTITSVKHRADGQARTQLRTAWLFDGRDRWNDTYVELPHPNLGRLDKVARHQVVVRHAAAS